MRKIELKQTIEQIGLSPKKELGQNFLASDKIAERIVNAACVSENDFVVELGPGMGIVSEKILNRNANLLAIEIDRKLSTFLKDKFSTFHNFQIIENDFFRLKLNQYTNATNREANKFISNPPYKGAKKLLKELCITNCFSRCVVTLQKEVARTLFSKPGESSARSLTYYTHYRFKPVKLFDIPPGFFYPQPSITSTVVLLSYKDHNINPKDEKFFFATLDLLLKTRKRKLRNCLTSTFNVRKEISSKIVEESEVSENARPTDLTMEQMITVSNLVRQEFQKN